MKQPKGKKFLTFILMVFTKPEPQQDTTNL